MSVAGALEARDGVLWLGTPASEITPGVALLPHGVRLHRPDGEVVTVRWDEVEDARVQVPQSRWRRPGLVFWLSGLLQAALLLWTPDTPDQLGLLVLRRGGGAVRGEASGHRKGGYWAADVRTAESYVELLVRDESGARHALAQPDRLVELLSLAARAVAQGRGGREELRHLLVNDAQVTP